MAFLDETGLAYFWNQILARLNKFVPAESGKGLSSNDYTAEEKEKLAGIEVGANKTIVDSTLSATSTNPVQNKVVNTKFNTIQAEVDSKVDSIDGKGLSTEDYTTDEKTKLASIAEGAEINVQADWNEADTSSDAYIVNKPTIPSKTSDLTNDSGFLTSIPDEYVTETELTAKGYLTSYTETDPTVPAWAKQPEKPSYTADEVGALSAKTLPEAINTALAQAKASGEFDGADGQDGQNGAPGQDGITPTIGDNGNWYLGDTDTGKPSRGDTGPKGEKGEKGDTGDTGPQGIQGPAGPQGPQGEQGPQGIQGETGPTGADGKSAYAYAVEGGYTGTEAEFAAKLAEDIPAVDTTLTVSGSAADAKETGTRLNTLSGELDNFIASGGFSAPIVDSVDEMVDTSKQYILKSTGTIWAYKSSTTEQEVTVTDELDDTTYYDGSRFGSSATGLTDGFHNDATGYHVTPLVDLTKAEYQGKTIQIHFEGAKYITSASETWIQNRYYKTDGSVQYARGPSSPSYSGSMGAWKNATITINSETSATIEIAMPLLYGRANVQCGYLRFCGKGAVADSHIYITYKDTQTVTSEQWVDTGIQYGGGGLDAETAAKISELNNEGTDPTTVTLLPADVLAFYNSAAYPDDDYTVTHLSRITYPCRADIPVPYTVKWNYNESAMRTTVAVDTRAIGTVNAYTMRTYDATGLNKFPIYNLLPNKTYYYKVTHVLSDGSLVEAKSGNFTTSSEAWRLLYIDGTQNVRDLGGWTGLNGKRVKYGNIIRGAALNDSSLPELLLTGKGRRSLGELAIQAELNLGATDTETSIASNCVYKKIGYTNYAIAFTGEAYRAQFKEVLEWIVDCLTASKPVYMHCQGGCDRTGTLAFQILGLLGVSESDLAKEYELSSFSNIGFGRLRTTTKAVDTYDYVGMVEALKAYSGATVADKFYDFATTGCGISADTITNFRNLMLE